MVVLSALMCTAAGGAVQRGWRWRVEGSAGTQITDLAVNDHACLTFGDPEEQFDLTAAFVRDGLAGGLKVMWLSDGPSGQALATLGRRGITAGPAVAAGQMIAAAWEGSVLSGHAFAAGQAMDWLTGQMAASRREGFPGLRIAMDMGWALRPVTGIEQLPQFEEGVAAALSGSSGIGAVPVRQGPIRSGHARLGRGFPHPLGRGRHLPRRRAAADLPPVRAAGIGSPGSSTTRPTNRWPWRSPRRYGSTATSPST